MLRLFATHEHEVRECILRDGATVRIGAAATNDFVIDFPGVSRHHAILTAKQGALTLSDLASKNGLVVDGQRVKSVMLRSDVVVQLGQASLRLDDLATPDTVLAIEIDAAQAPGSPPGSTPIVDNVTVGAEAAIRLMRDVELGEVQWYGHGRDLFFERLRTALSAQTICIAVNCDQQFGILECYGYIPNTPITLVTLHNDASPWLAVPLNDDLFLAACLPHSSRKTSWRRQVLELVGAKIGEAASDQRPRPDRPDAQLCFATGIVRGDSPAMRRVYADVQTIIRSDLNVLLLGEPGTGKEVIAQLIHDSRPDRTGPFTPVNCAAISPGLFETEFFGIEKGAATNITASRDGYFAAADHGTLFLDEIGELPASFQAGLLRVIEDRSVLRVGGQRRRHIDVRVISATNADLAALRARSAFRDDLYHRLSGEVLFLPPLRERREDILSLALSFLQSFATDQSKSVRGVSYAAAQRLMQHSWPGNVRELRDTMKRAVARTPNRGLVRSEHLVFSLDTPKPEEPALLKNHTSAAEHTKIMETLASTGGNVSAAARLLGLSRSGLYKKLQRLDRP